MDVTKLLKRKLVLSQAIATQVSALVEEFKEETGFSPRNIYIDMVCVDVTGGAVGGYVVGACHASLVDTTLKDDEEHRVVLPGELWMVDP